MNPEQRQNFLTICIAITKAIVTAGGLTKSALFVSLHEKMSIKTLEAILNFLETNGYIITAEMYGAALMITPTDKAKSSQFDQTLTNELTN